MNNKPSLSPSGIYLLDPQLDSQQLYDATRASLCKAEALAAVAASVDLHMYEPETVSNYLWVLSDLVRESAWLFGKLLNKN
jgi:hypothetical protein